MTIRSDIIVETIEPGEDNFFLSKWQFVTGNKWHYLFTAERYICLISFVLTREMTELHGF